MAPHWAAAPQEQNMCYEFIFCVTTLRPPKRQFFTDHSVEVKVSPLATETSLNQAGLFFANDVT